MSQEFTMVVGVPAVHAPETKVVGESLVVGVVDTEVLSALGAFATKVTVLL